MKLQQSTVDSMISAVKAGNAPADVVAEHEDQITKDLQVGVHPKAAAGINWSQILSILLPIIIQILSGLGGGTPAPAPTPTPAKH